LHFKVNFVLYSSSYYSRPLDVVSRLVEYYIYIHVEYYCCSQFLSIGSTTTLKYNINIHIGIGIEFKFKFDQCECPLNSTIDD